MNAPDKATRSDWAVFAVLALMALAPAVIAGNGDFTFPDASRHAMDGVFVLDAFAERPLAHPLDWAKRYYLTSPALGIGRYPPLFALMEAPFYAILGVCPFAARLAGAIVWFAGLVFFYETVRVQLGRIPGFFAAAVLAAGPASVRWGCDVMLELPAVAFLVAASYFYLRYVGEGRRRMLLCAVTLVCLAAWTKQPAALLLSAFAVHLFVTRKLVPGDVLAAATLAVVLLVPLAVLSVAFGKANVAIVSGLGRSYPLWSAGNWLYYLYQVPRWYLGWPVTFFLPAGIIMAFMARNRTNAAFYFLWSAVFYLFFSIVGLKSSRLAMFWMPGLAWFAAAGLAFLLTAKRKGAAAAAKFVAAVAVVSTYCFAFDLVPRKGDELLAVAAEVAPLSPERVFYVGAQNGTFIFRLRQVAGRDRPVTIRDSKVLYHDFIAKELGRTEKPWSFDEIRSVTASLAPDVVVLETSLEESARPDSVRLFAEYTRTEDFEKIAVIRRRRGPLERFQILAYRGPRRPAPLRIPMPGVGMELELPPERP